MNAFWSQYVQLISVLPLMLVGLYALWMLVSLVLLGHWMYAGVQVCYEWMHQCANERSAERSAERCGGAGQQHSNGVPQYWQHVRTFLDTVLGAKVHLIGVHVHKTDDAKVQLVRVPAQHQHWHMQVSALVGRHYGTNRALNWQPVWSERKLLGCYAKALHVLAPWYWKAWYYGWTRQVALLLCISMVLGALLVLVWVPLVPWLTGL